MSQSDTLVRKALWKSTISFSCCAIILSTSPFEALSCNMAPAWLMCSDRILILSFNVFNSGTTFSHTTCVIVVSSSFFGTFAFTFCVMLSMSCMIVALSASFFSHVPLRLDNSCFMPCPRLFISERSVPPDFVISVRTFSIANSKCDRDALLSTFCWRLVAFASHSANLSWATCCTSASCCFIAFASASKDSRSLRILVSDVSSCFL
mmetsp:Transcript_99214/g.172151  ORF Transcript_99214/g.172151 Transcript_99214/m.172151 type:complete len:207 (+) Transcript_99214:672-1292(+)